MRLALGSARSVKRLWRLKKRQPARRASLKLLRSLGQEEELSTMDPKVVATKDCCLRSDQHTRGVSCPTVSLQPKL